MATFENFKTSRNGHKAECEFHSFPVAFVNGIRRTLLSGLPVVCVRDVQILENTTQMPHEMLKHRVEMLPVNVKPSDSGIIRDAQIELRILPEEKIRDIHTSDFVVTSGREHILMNDRDLDTPLLFLRIAPKEQVHVKARLAIETSGVSNVCLATTSYRVDPERAKRHREEWVKQGNDPRVFDSFQIQRSYHVDENGRPTWIDMKIESIGVIPPRELLKMTVQTLRKQVTEWITEAKENITRESEKGSYHVKLPHGGHTMGALLQEVIYYNEDTEFIAQDIPHPLLPNLVLRFHTSKNPEEVLANALQAVNEYCDKVDKE